MKDVIAVLCFSHGCLIVLVCAIYRRLTDLRRDITLAQSIVANPAPCAAKGAETITALPAAPTLLPSTEPLVDEAMDERIKQENIRVFGTPYPDALNNPADVMSNNLPPRPVMIRE